MNTSKDPLPRVGVVLAQRQHPGHDAPGRVEDGHLHQDFVLVNHGDFLFEFLGPEPVVDLPRVHVHQDVVGVLEGREVVQRRRRRVLVGVELEGHLLIGSLDLQSCRGPSDLHQLVVVRALLLELQTCFYGRDRY